ncbi:MAG: alpha/beta fold hydrolase [Pseudomonadota bacterium]
MKNLKFLAVACALVCAPALAQEQALEIEVDGPAGTLRGTLAGYAENEARPAILIVPGSGPTDRDGNNPLGVEASSYRLLAEGLSEAGITTVRIDKRGMFGSAIAGLDPNAITIEDYGEDTNAWVRQIIDQTGVDCVWILGHSEGGLVALVAGQDGPDICGMILLAAPGRSMGDTIRAQLQANPANAPLIDDALSAIDLLERGESVDPSGMHPALQQLFDPAVQGFLINVMSFDPADLIAGYDGPVLVLQGDADIQIPVADAERLAGGREGVTLTILPNINHVLKSVTADDQAGNLAAYSDPTLPLAPGIVEAIVDFIAEHN